MMKWRTSRWTRLVNRYSSIGISSKSLLSSCDSDEMMHCGYHHGRTLSLLSDWRLPISDGIDVSLFWCIWRAINRSQCIISSYKDMCQVCQSTNLTWHTLQIVTDLKWSEHFIISNINHVHIEESEIDEIANWWWQHCQCIWAKLITMMNRSDCEWNESDGKPSISADQSAIQFHLATHWFHCHTARMDEWTLHMSCIIAAAFHPINDDEKWEEKRRIISQSSMLLICSSLQRTTSFFRFDSIDICRGTHVSPVYSI